MTVKAAEKVSCDEVLNACDAALKAKTRELDLADLGIKIRTDEMDRLNKENTELRNQGSSVLSNPFIWAAIGVILGAYAGARATR